MTDWKTVSPVEAGFSPDIGDHLLAAFERGELPNLHAVLMARDGKLVLEQYFEGPDERWGQPLGVRQHGPDELHDLRSVSKSIVSVLYGIALADEKVPPLDAPIVDQFGYDDLASDPERRKMLVEHALTMTLGTEWDETIPYDDPRNSEIAMEMADDRYRFILGRAIVAAPGSQWVYSGGATALIAHLIAKGTDRPLLDFAQEKLFGPLGVESVDWVLGTNGEPAAASGLRLRARDLLKIGQLVLDRGLWNGKQIVPSEWLAASFKNTVPSEDGLVYGYQWWLGKGRGDGYDWMAGFGNGGQRLVIIPDLGLVIVVLAGNYNQRDAWRVPVSIIGEILLPALDTRQD